MEMMHKIPMKLFSIKTNKYVNLQQIYISLSMQDYLQDPDLSEFDT